MKVIVVGAGLIGSCTAWWLQRAGCQVTLLERRSGAGLETSFANAGMVTPSMPTPWNTPGVFGQLLRWLGRSDAPMLLRPSAIPFYGAWGLKFLRHARADWSMHAARANLALAQRSLQLMQTLRAELPQDYERREAGTLQLFDTDAGLQAAIAEAEALAPLGLRHQPLSPDALVALEPALAAVRGRYVGGVHYPDDETGDAHRFCVALVEQFVQAGGELRTGVEVSGPWRSGGRCAGVHTDVGTLAADAVVISAAAHSPSLAWHTPLAIKPVKGYSLTVPDVPDALSPTRSLIDHGLHAAITPLNGRLRLAGTAEFCGWSARIDPARIQALWGLLEAVLPATAAQLDRQRATPWVGFRPMSADGLPSVGRGGLDGLYVNAGHGHLGWSQCLGSAELLAHHLLGADAAVDPACYAVTRKPCA